MASSQRNMSFPGQHSPEPDTVNVVEEVDKNMPDRRRKGTVTNLAKMYKLHLDCNVQFYHSMYIPDSNQWIVLNTAPDVPGFSPDHATLMQMKYPRPQFNTPSNPGYYLKKAMERMGTPVPDVSAAPSGSDAQASDAQGPPAMFPTLPEPVVVNPGPRSPEMFPSLMAAPRPRQPAKHAQRKGTTVQEPTPPTCNPTSSDNAVNGTQTVASSIPLAQDAIPSLGSPIRFNDSDEMIPIRKLKRVTPQDFFIPTKRVRVRKETDEHSVTTLEAPEMPQTPPPRRQDRSISPPPAPSTSEKGAIHSARTGRTGVMYTATGRRVQKRVAGGRFLKRKS